MENIVPDHETVSMEGRKSRLIVPAIERTFLWRNLDLECDLDQYCPWPCVGEILPSYKTVSIASKNSKWVVLSFEKKISSGVLLILTLTLTLTLICVVRDLGKVSGGGCCWSLTSSSGRIGDRQ